MRKPHLFVALALAACVPDIDEMSNEARRYKDAAISAVDSAPTTATGTVSCYTEGAPTNSCTLPIHCCFSGYSAQHNGYCTTDACSFGTIDCDGPEDCEAGQTCCSHAITSADDGIIGYRLACQTGACGAPPLDEELCHATSSCSHGSCVNVYGVNNDLPRTLYVCR